MEAESPERDIRREDAVVLIDGHCYLCQGITGYVVRHDRKKALRLATLQSPAGVRILKECGLPVDDLRSFVFVQRGRHYTRSTAALRVLRAIGGWRSLLYALIVIPAPVRNLVYDTVARNRYRWFGQSESCLLPTPDVAMRFLHDGR